MGCGIGGTCPGLPNGVQMDPFRGPKQGSDDLSQLRGLGVRTRHNMLCRVPDVLQEDY